jgi:hypothetical protein
MSKKRNFNNTPKGSQMTQENQAVQVLDEQEVVVEAVQEVSIEETEVAEEVSVQAPQEPVQAVQEAPAVVSKYSEGLTHLLDLCAKSGNAALNNYVGELLDYAQKMAPSQTMHREQGAINQAAFYNTLVCIVDHTGKDFRLGFATMLSIFNEYKKGAFSGTHVLRFMEDVPLNKNKRDAFIKMVNLFSMTADGKTRKSVLKHLDLKRELLNGVSEEGKARIASFYAA